MNIQEFFNREKIIIDFFLSRGKEKIFSFCDHIFTGKFSLTTSLYHLFYKKILAEKLGRTCGKGGVTHNDEEKSNLQTLRE